MKLNNDVINFIQKVVETSQLVNISNVIIEPTFVRAIDDNKSVVIFQPLTHSVLSDNSIGLTRINIFSSRLEISKSQTNFNAEATIHETENFIKIITMKSAGTKIEYRCAKPSTIQAPRQIHDEMITRISLDSEAVSLLQKSQVAMDNAETVTIINNDVVSFEVVDINGDVFNHTFTKPAVAIEGNDSIKFAHKYSIKTLLALFKKDVNNTVEIGKRGILRITINGLDVYVLPRV